MHQQFLYLLYWNNGIDYILNFHSFCSYVHRVGRTARAGREGYAVTFVTDNDRSLLKAIVSEYQFIRKRKSKIGSYSLLWEIFWDKWGWSFYAVWNLFARAFSFRFMLLEVAVRFFWYLWSFNQKMKINFWCLLVFTIRIRNSFIKLDNNEFFVNYFRRTVRTRRLHTTFFNCFFLLFQTTFAVHWQLGLFLLIWGWIFLCELVFVGHFLPYLHTCFLYSELTVGLDFNWQAKRAGSKLKSRIVAEQSIKKWSEIIEQMEDQVTTILQEERFLHMAVSLLVCPISLSFDYC